MKEFPTSSPTQWLVVPVQTAEQLDVIRELFVEYARSTNAGVCFQNFEREVAGLPGSYSPPQGRLLLALQGGQPAGCVALRDLGAGISEMKRLYVRPAFRGDGAGRRLARRIIEEAIQAGYRRMRLDTLPNMQAAIALYRSLGFIPIAAYGNNAEPSALYFELALQ